MSDLSINYPLLKNQAILITTASNIFYLTGFQGTYGLVLKTKNKICLFTDARYLNEATRKIQSTNIEIIASDADLFHTLFKQCLKNKISSLQFEAENLSYQNYLKLRKTFAKKKKFLITSTQNIVKKFRAIKSKAEIAKITKAQRITEYVLAEIKKYLKKGVREIEIAWLIEKIGRENGAENISFPPLVCFEKNAAIPHHQNSPTRLKKGDLVLLDFGFKYKGYCSDMTRTFFTKSPTSFQSKIYQLVLEAQNLAIAKIKPGLKGFQTDKIARDYFEKAGYSNHFTHSLGHGVGIDIHELPNLSPKSKKRADIILKNNMVVTIEPGLYFEGKWGIRIEDMLVINQNHPKILTTAPKNIAETLLTI